MFICSGYNNMRILTINNQGSWLNQLILSDAIFYARDIDWFVVEQPLLTIHCIPCITVCVYNRTMDLSPVWIAVLEPEYSNAYNDQESVHKSFRLNESKTATLWYYDK